MHSGITFRQFRAVIRFVVSNSIAGFQCLFFSFFLSSLQSEQNIKMQNEAIMKQQQHACQSIHMKKIYIRDIIIDGKLPG